MDAVDEFFRSMAPAADELPAVGRSARMLGVRVPEDIQPDAEGNVRPGIGGLSVAPASIWNLPTHRRPRGMKHGSTGKPADRVYAVSGDALAGHRLGARPDPHAPARHAFIEPTTVMPLTTYEDAVAATRPVWRQAWP